MNPFRYWQPVAAFILIFIFGALLVVADALKYIEKHKQTALQLAGAESSILTQHLNTSISLTYTLETLLRQKKFEITQEDLEGFSSQLLHQHPFVSSLQYSPEGIVSFVVPLEENRAAIGHHLLKDPKRNKEAFDAVEKHLLTVAGPFELIQGGIALAARLPIYKGSGPQQVFWGFSTVLIRIDDLIRAAETNKLESQGFDWNLYRIHPDTKLPHIFHGSTTEVIEDSVKLEVSAPNAKWYLNLKPVGGWLSGYYWRLLLLLAVFAFIAFGGGCFAYYFYRQPLLLKEQVEMRTAELYKAKEVLANSEKRLLQIADNSQMWIWEIDSKGMFTYCSQACDHILGYSVGEIVGNKYFYDLYHPEDRSDLMETALEIMQGRQAFREFPNRNLSRTGEQVWFSTSGVPILDDHGRLVGYRGANIDITHNKKLMEEQTRSAQLAALGTVAAGVAHEINNPIQGIMNYATLISQSPGQTNRVVDVAQRIIQESERIASITKDLLYYSKDSIVKMVVSDIHGFIKSAISLIETKVRRQGIAIETRFADELPLIAIHPQAIQQVIINLVDNAFDALRVKDIPTSEKVITVTTRLLGRGDNQQVCIEVHDNGAGMTKGARLRAKEAFFSTKPSAEGTGLGLSIVNDIVTNHGGTFNIDSKENEYTRVEILLPVLQEASMKS